MDANMARAKKLIEQKRYVEARKVLAQTSDPRSLDWIDKIDGILLRNPDANKSSKTGLYALLSIVAVVVLLVVAFRVVTHNAVNARYDANEPEAHSALSTFCATNTRIGYVYCDEYANNVIDADRSRIDPIMICKEIANPITEGEQFAYCLTSDHIPLPH